MGFLGKVGDVLGGISSIATGFLGFKGAKEAGERSSEASALASQAQIEAARIAADTQLAMFEKSNRLLEPRRDIANLALGRAATYANRLGLQDFDYKRTPEYQFLKEEQRNALINRQSQTGNLLSGRGFKDALRYATGLAGQEQDAIINRTIARQINPQLAIAGQGQAATLQGAQNALLAGRDLAGLATQTGAARASGFANHAAAQNLAQQGRYNALGQIIGGATDIFQNLPQSSGGGRLALPGQYPTVWRNPNLR